MTGSHVPLNSIPLVNYNDTFSISRGGTGKVVFDSQGVIYTRSSEYQTDSSNLSITNGRMGIKTTPKNTHMVSIGTSTDSIFAVEANHNNDATLRLENSVATWNFIVDSMGDLNIKNPTDLVLKIKQNGMVGFWYESVGGSLTQWSASFGGNHGFASKWGYSISKQPVSGLQ